MLKKKIMVVDDEEIFMAFITDLLRDNGYSVIQAYNGKEALKKLKKTKPDLIILDIMMPGISGRELCERIRKNPKTRGLKVIFLTVVEFSETGKAMLKEMGVLDYITKPLNNVELLARIKKALDF